MPDNLQPNSYAARRSILNFAKSMVSVSILKAIQILLTPCCSVTATGEAVCTSKAGIYTLTITLSQGITLSGQGLATITGDPNYQIVNYVDGSTTLVFNNVAVSAGTRHVTLFLTMTPGTQVASAGESIPFTGYAIGGISVVFPTC